MFLNAGDKKQGSHRNNNPVSSSDGTRKAVVFATMAKLSTDGSLGLGKIHAMQLFDEVVSVEQSKDWPQERRNDLGHLMM